MLNVFVILSVALSVVAYTLDHLGRWYYELDASQWTYRSFEGTYC